MSYTHLFFDLDHTLWDFEKNSRITLVELFEEKQLDRLGVPDFDAFYTAYKEENDLLWARYRKGEIKKDELRSSRFHNTLKRFGDGDDRCASEIEQAYIERSPYQTQLLPGAMETVRVLSTRYSLHIITNGFSEIQNIKMERSGLAPYFDSVFSSEAVGVQKPDARVFLHALKETGAKRKESLMIGDSLEADVLGARRVGMEAVYFNPESKPHGASLEFEIRDLKDLLQWL